MSIEGLALILAVLAAVAWWWMRRAAPDEDDGEDEPAHASPFHCVAINPGEGACRTARTLKGIRFLSAEAPLLPLASCDARRCRCTFSHHRDRRRGDRRNPYSAESHSFAFQGGSERRMRHGRRATDGMRLAETVSRV